MDQFSRPPRLACHTARLQWLSCGRLRWPSYGLVALVLLVAVPFTGSVCALAQSDNSTELVYASTFVPFDSSFAEPAFPVNSFAKFPAGFKRVNKLKLDSTQLVCGTQDTNGDGDVTDPEDLLKERFEEIYVGFVLRNHSSEPLTIDGLQYEVAHVAGRTVRSTTINPVTRVVAAPGKDAAALFLFAKSHPIGRRRFVGQTKPIPRRLLRRSVVYRITAHTARRKGIVITHRDLIGFRERNNCSQ